MKFVDLFCGLGGASLGALNAGLTPVALIDSEVIFGKVLSETLRPHFEVSNLSVLKDNVIELVCSADVLLCSPPCQSFSTLKSSNRSFVATEFDDAFLQNIARLADEARPSTIMIENVPSFTRYAEAHRLKFALKALGYKTAFEVVDAADMGVPQRRRRAILVAAKSKPHFQLMKSKKSVREAFHGLVEINTTDPLHQRHRKHSDLVMRRIRAVPKDGGCKGPRCHQNSSLVVIKDQTAIGMYMEGWHGTA